MLRNLQRKMTEVRRLKPSAFGVAALCLLLLLLLLAAQVGHLHPIGVDADHCPLCVMLHTAVPVMATAMAVLLVAMQASMPRIELQMVRRYWYARLYTRPPPAVSLYR